MANSHIWICPAPEYEVNRHIGLLEGGASEVEQQTRGFDATTATTFKLRSKADAPDYRYMPDPELAPLVVPEVRVLSPMHSCASAHISLMILLDNSAS